MASTPSAPRLSESYRVLIVEDNADALESLRLQMELWGTEVSTAQNAEEALAIAAQVRPQIVLCDIGLPGMDGFRLIEPLREKLKGAPVVFAAVTGYASGEDQQRALDAGFDSFFVKPLNPGSLANLLRSYASRRLAGARRAQRTSSSAPGSLTGSPSSAAYSLRRL